MTGLFGGYAQAYLTGTSCAASGSTPGVWTDLTSPSLGTVVFGDGAGLGTNVATYFTVPKAGLYTLKYSWTGTSHAAISEWAFFSVPTVSLTGTAAVCGTSQEYTYTYNWGDYPQVGAYEVKWYAYYKTAPTTPVLITAPTSTATPTTNAANQGEVNKKFTFDFAQCGVQKLEVVFEAVAGVAKCSNVTADFTANFVETPVVTANGTNLIVNDCRADGYTLVPTVIQSCDANVTLTQWWEIVTQPVGGNATITANVLTADVCGAYVVARKVSNAVCGTVTATATVNFFDTPTGVTVNNNIPIPNICTTESYVVSPTATICEENLNGVPTTRTWAVSPATGTMTGNSFGATVCGTYTITYTVSNGICAAAVATATVNVYEPVAGVTANTNTNPRNICKNESYNLVPGYTAPTCFAGDYTTSWSVSPATGSVSGNVFTATACGTYVVSYTVSNGECDPVTATVAINVYEPVTGVIANQSLASKNICITGTYTLTPTYTVPPAGCFPLDYTTSWSVTPSGATVVSNVFEATACGTYTITYMVSNGICDPVTATEVINVYEEVGTVIANTSTATKNICMTSDYTLVPFYTTPTCFGPYTTSWSVSPATGTMTGNVFSATACGVYTITYSVTNGICNAKTATEVINVYDTPTSVVADNGGDGKSCFPGTYTLNPTYSLNCETPFGATKTWEHTYGSTVTFVANTVTVPNCGSYEFFYKVDNGVCPSVSGSTTIFFSDPGTVTATAPANVCGYNADVTVAYTHSCPGTITPTLTLKTKPSGAADPTIGAFQPAKYSGAQGKYAVTVTKCGEYVFTYTVLNNECTNTKDVTIRFYETPDPGIVTTTANTNVYACSSVVYEIEDNRTCEYGTLKLDLTVINGTFEPSGLTTMTINQTAGSTVSVTVNWNNTLTAGNLYVAAALDGFASCEGNDELSNITKIAPTFAGQVKYWNQFETYMPTPFATNINGTFPHDYFYVELGIMDGYTFVPVTNSVRKVEPFLYEDPTTFALTDYMSYFAYDLMASDNSFTCDKEYVLRIWDGGLNYHPTAPTEAKVLGANYTFRKWGGVNATDALAVQLMVTNQINNGIPLAGVGTPFPSMSPAYGFYSNEVANVNRSVNGITSLDALTVNYRSVNLIANYPDINTSTFVSNQFAPNFAVAGRLVSTLPSTTWSSVGATAAFDVNNPNDVQFVKNYTPDYLYFTSAADHYYQADLPWEGKANYINVYYQALGDVNSSYVPTNTGTFKTAPINTLNYEGEIIARVGDVINIPVALDRYVEMGAISLGLDYRKDLIEVTAVNYGSDYVNVNKETGNVRIGWFDMDGVSVEEGQAVAVITVKVLAEIEAGTRLFELEGDVEVADRTATPIADVNFKSKTINTGKAMANGQLSVINIPNPFNNSTIISCNLPEAGKVTVKVYNSVGQIVRVVENNMAAGTQTIEFNRASMQAGVYHYTVTLNGQNGDYSVTKSMIVVE